eukprot:TRINITY_DN12868_c0_g1_i1.p1 TRINITY_DN12868_c0_g1~~TRINITY_DN12868_c0_g1_i1.p1  ORF type:complete len:125 (-),score=2.24 TRINITY_DN12868_c0_g1_i1:310-684(-)
MLRQVLKFGSVGVVNTLLDFAVLNLLAGLLGWPVVPANTISFSIAVTNSFFMNKYWTFEEREGKMHIQFGGFVIVAVVGLLLSDFLVYLFAEDLGWHYNWAKVVSILPVFVWNFLASKYFIFKK